VSCEHTSFDDAFGDAQTVEYPDRDKNIPQSYENLLAKRAATLA
jgi:hypothetical protein